MVSGAGWLFDFVAFRYLGASLHLILLIKMVPNIAIRRPEVTVLIEPLQVFVFLSLFFAHVMHPSGSELGQRGFRRPVGQSRAVQLADFAVAEIAADVALAGYHLQICHLPS